MITFQHSRVAFRRSFFRPGFMTLASASWHDRKGWWMACRGSRFAKALHLNMWKVWQPFWNCCCFKSDAQTVSSGLVMEMKPGNDCESTEILQNAFFFVFLISLWGSFNLICCSTPPPSLLNQAQIRTKASALDDDPPLPPKLTN